MVFECHIEIALCTHSSTVLRSVSDNCSMIAISSLCGSDTRKVRNALGLRNPATVKSEIKWSVYQIAVPFLFKSILLTILLFYC